MNLTEGKSIEKLTFIRSFARSAEFSARNSRNLSPVSNHRCAETWNCFDNFINNFARERPQNRCQSRSGREHARLAVKNRSILIFRTVLEAESDSGLGRLLSWLENVSKREIANSIATAGHIRCSRHLLSFPSTPVHCKLFNCWSNLAITFYCSHYFYGWSDLLISERRIMSCGRGEGRKFTI